MMNYQKQMFLSMKKAVLSCCVIGLSVSSVYAGNIQVQYRPVQCLVAGRPAEITGEVRSESKIAEARLYFKIPKAEDFYVVRLRPISSGRFTAILPAPQSDVREVRYQLFFADQDGQAVKSPLLTVNVVIDAAACSQTPPESIPQTLAVFAETSIPPEIGFSGTYLAWKVSEEDALAPPYLRQAKEVQIAPSPKGAAASPKFRIGTKTAIGLGAGAGIAAAIGLAAGGGGGGGESIWGSLDDTAKNVTAELVKTPEIQTSCGTVVTNQLFVTNESEADVSIGTIEYEIVLTEDDPEGSCAPGRTGAFAPNLATMIAPGEILLIREWVNEVNPCSGCPYPVAECVWKSRYVVHTSAGSAAAYSTFKIEGDLCAASVAAKPYAGYENQLQGDIEP